MVLKKNFNNFFIAFKTVSKWKPALKSHALQIAISKF